jgi:DnaD/phage-associated family protein
MSNISMTMRHEYSETPISNAFIDRYMMKANPVYSLIYIYGVRLCMGGGGGLSSAELAQALNILESDVVNAWKYWEKEGLVQLMQSGEEMDIVFLPPAAKTAPAKLSREKAPVFLETRPQYTLDELEIYQNQSKEIRGLFKHAERALGKMLTYNDLNVIFGFYDWLRLPLPVIEFLLTYCGDHEHRDLRYIEKAAAEWADKEIDSVEKAQTHVQTFNRDYKQILRALGSASGTPSPTQKSSMDKWLFTYRMPLEIILEACDICAVEKGGAKLNYVDGILKGWNEKDIRTLEAVRKDREVFKKEKERSKGTRKPPEKVNRFVNFNQRKNDYTELERLELEQLKQSVKG